MVGWIESMLVHGPGDVQGQRIELDDEFVKFILNAYLIDDRGRRVVRRGVISRAKGRAKSELAAMLGCAEALGPVRFAGWGHDGRPLGRSVQSPFIPTVATEEGQAGNVYAAIEFMLTEGAVSATEGLSVGKTRTFLPDGGKIVPFSAKSTSKDGGRETFAIFDETHLFIQPDLIKLHETIRRNLTKRKDAQPWSLETSTMYAPGEGSIAEASHHYAQAIASGKLNDSGFLFDHREGPAEFDYDDDEQLRAALVEAYGAAAEWTDFERRIAEARDPMTNQADFLRYFVNRATRREDELFISRDQFEACLVPVAKGETLVAEGAASCLGIDGSRTFDTTVVAWAAVAGEDEVTRADGHVFSVRKDAPHHTLHSSASIDYDDVESFTLDRFDYLDVKEAAYDPRYLDRSADILSARLPSALIIAVEPHSRWMREALQTLERLVKEQRIELPDDPVLVAHFMNARVERAHTGEIRRVVKIDPRKPIDAVIALALAVWRATRARVSPYEERDIIVL